jgi:tRNA nucleotidyltransferase (CCA-adding enzyme)
MFMLVPMEFKQPIHPLAVEVCRILQGAGYQAYIVGGCVRDLHLNITPKDFDITTNATPEQVGQLFVRTIPTGLQHGTVTVCMGENHFEVTTFRVEGEYKDGRRPEEVKFVSDIVEDLARRDLTINAIAFDPINNLEVDPFHGLQDIEKKIIRAVGDPTQRFQEDGLRIMRVARFAARFGYTVEEETFKGMKEALETLKKVSKERISDELCKTLMATNVGLGLTYLKGCGALELACPLLGFWRPASLMEQDRCCGELETKLAFLYHKAPIIQVEQELIDLKMSSKEIKRVVFLLTTLEQFFYFKENSTLSAYRKFMARIKNKGPDPWEHTYQQFIELIRALQLPFEKLSFYEDEEVPARKELAINGDDLMAEGVKPGPNLKVLLDSCYQEILEHPEHNNREYLLNMLIKKL